MSEINTYTEDSTVLHLNYSGIKKLSDKDLLTKCFQKAQYLYLKRNLIKTLPRSVKQLTSLQQIHLEGNSLECLPEEIGDLYSLQVLNVVSNHLTHLPGSIGRLKALKKLQISNNNLQCLPKEVGNLLGLETLEASSNQLTSVPISLAHCSELKLLALDKNRLKLFPRQLCRLQKLTELSLAGNLLEYLPPLIFEELSALHFLVIDQNPGVTAYPSHQGDIHVSHCGLIPKDTEANDRLKHLDIQGQRISMPEEFEELCEPGKSCVPCLQELSLRAVHPNLSSEFVSVGELLPVDLTDRLMYPTSRCLYCMKMLFRSAFPVIYQESNRTVLTSAFCCSVKCITETQVSIQNQLLFPVCVS
ncbi:leucine-rich repeat-containing protein 28-like [Mercenaria mercenaria]|uniref:leucine-rich repeat-containing protein 28-like n=1 Tax=Mercenaria mercenaria TaxID=6596 RepID=UPI00234F9B02|nr:leucine-rich repeat-containing protein 28-like [Mercenaria mercenaria]